MAQDTRDAHESQAKPLTELVRDLTEDATALIRQEVELAKAEIQDKAKAFRAGAGLFGAAATLGWFALGALTAAGIAALALVLPVWAAALAVSALLGITAGILAMRGKRKVKDAAPPLPTQTLDSVKEDIQWLKERSR